MESQNQNIETSPSPSPRHKTTRPAAATKLIPSCICATGSEEPPATEASTVRSPPSSIRKMAAELKDCCLGLTGKSPRRRRGEFTYDPISYALNFDDGDDGVNTEENSRRCGNGSIA
ncbi:hypothetical protein MA16_Dca010581 [Dendrobium catenatum]|uniref:Uncharacterized protein n=1 Tax=Dendrobium catenatum TaxID=906689 RepID=A0A2I0VZK4_9ASPA|nr:hypothetical protein MA16_Dca010581 [Dendrobium catenatum]